MRIDSDGRALSGDVLEETFGWRGGSDASGRGNGAGNDEVVQVHGFRCQVQFNWLINRPAKLLSDAARSRDGRGLMSCLVCFALGSESATT